MNSEDLSKVLLVMSCEEEDPSGQFLTMSDRQRANRLASQTLEREHATTVSEELEQQAVVTRAQHLASNLEGKYSILQTARRLTQKQVSIGLILGLAILGGFLGDPIGVEVHINLLHFPLLTLILWNLSAYVLAGGRGVMEKIFDNNNHTDGITNWLVKLGSWMMELKLRFFGPSNDDEKCWLVASMTKFFRLWSSLAGKAVGHQAKSVLHWCAAGLAFGVMLGMYLRGFALEYRASWESTFLDAEQVHNLLVFVLSPASILLGVDFPSVQTLVALKAPGSENAALWIHLWAVTCLLIIVIPRIGLALWARRMASRHTEAVTLPLEQPYFSRLLAQYRGDGLWVEVLPYQCQLDHSEVERLEGFCLEMFGNGAYVQTKDPIPYGETVPQLSVSGNVPLRVVTIFDVATTPEQEVHGEFLRDTQQQMADLVADASLLVFIHEGVYQKRADHQRLEERYQAWQRFTNRYGLEPLLFSTATGVNAMLQQANTRLWSPHSEEVQ